MLCSVALDISEELSPSFIRVTRNGELGTTLAVFNLALCHNDRWGVHVPTIFVYSNVMPHIPEWRRGSSIS
jgi:hypothetical protein